MKAKKINKKHFFQITILLCRGLQQTVDQKVDRADGVVCPLSQTPDEMLQIHFQVGAQKHLWVSDWWLDDRQHRLKKNQD